MAMTQRSSAPRGIGNGSRMTLMEEQLQGLRESVRREKERRGINTATTGRRSSATTTTTLKERPTARNVSGPSGVPPKRTSIHTTAISSHSGADRERGGIAAASASVETTLKRIHAFDLFQGTLLANDIAPGAESGVNDEYIVKAKQRHDEDFEAIESYRYDEEEERETSVKQPQPPPPAQSPKPKPKQGKRKVQINAKRNTNSSLNCMMSGKDKKGVWDIYEIRGDAARPPPATMPAGGADKTDKTTQRLAELQQILLTPPETGGDIHAHQRRQCAALEELQRLQGGGGGGGGGNNTPKPAATNTANPLSYSELTAKPVGGGGGGGCGGGGGKLLEGSYNEANNAKEFQDAIKHWRGEPVEEGKGKARMEGGGGGGGGAASKTHSATGSGAPMEQETASKLKDAFVESYAIFCFFFLYLQSVA